MRSSTTSAAVSMLPDFLPVDLCLLHSPLLSSSCHLTRVKRPAACCITGVFCLRVRGVMSVGKDGISMSSCWT